MPSDFYHNNAAINVNWIIIAVLLSIIAISALCNVYNIFSTETRQTNKRIKVGIKTFLIFTIIESIGYAIGYSSNFVLTQDNAANAMFETTSYLAGIVLCTAQAARCTAFAYFLKVQLEVTYEHEYFSINKPFINIFYLIFLILWIIYSAPTMMYQFLSYWDPKLHSSTVENIRAIALYCVALMAIIYPFTILVLFNMKLQKFISLTTSNDIKLSSDLKSLLKHAITKQTNLISIMIISILIYALSFIIFLFSDSSTTTVIYNWIYFVFMSILCIGMCLSLKGNDKYYAKYCKYCHNCCIVSCTKCSECRQKNKDKPHNLPLLSLQANNDDNFTTHMRIFDDYQPNICCEENKCDMVQSIIDFVCDNESNINSIDIIDNFHHLLLCHDSNEQFENIYNKITQKTKCDHFRECQIYSRHYQRRLENRQDKYKHEHEQKRDMDFDTTIKTYIIDKIHSFYYHSYDTNFRQRSTVKHATNTSMANMFQQFGGKFNSNLNVNDNTTVDNFSFGQRFEYQEEKHDWFVGPKYKDLKDELLNNTTCCISMDVCNIEYSKMLKYMNITRVKQIQNRNKQKDIQKNHILALLVYCNCDHYQNKWSASFRTTGHRETDESLKNKHSYFYHSSKYLRELVEDFGSKLIDYGNKDLILYHGVSTVLYFHRTITQFNGPLSTSKEINVALNFSNNVGIILYLKYSFSAYPLNAKCFDCSFFSDYTNEKECLFIGGIPMLIITNIYNVGNSENYKKYINALNVINCMLNGTYNRNTNDYTHNVSVIELCHALLSYQLTVSKQRSFDSEYPQYVINLLNKYCMNLVHITMFWNFIENMEQLQALFCGNIGLAFFDLSVLLHLFQNLKQIEYFNKSFENKKSSTEIKKIIKYIVNYKCDKLTDNTSLQYIIIHHYVSKLTLNCAYFGNENQNVWDLYQDENKTILYRKSGNIVFDMNEIDIHFNEITQGNISQNMLLNLAPI